MAIAESPDMEVFLTIPELAARWKVCKMTIQRMITRGELAGVRVGLGRGVWRVSWAEVARVEAGRRTAA